MITLGKARDAYDNQANLRSTHTRNAYMRSITLFLKFLDDRQFESQLPIQKHIQAASEDLSLSQLGGGDVSILKQFIQWMQFPAPNDRYRPYAKSTIELRFAGVLRWFDFMASKGWLPDEFDTIQVIELAKKEFITSEKALDEEKPDQFVEIKQDLTPLLDYYAQQKPPKSLQKSTERLHNWELSRLRNQALIQMLAEAGGQVSAILSLNVQDFVALKVPMIIGIRGKNNHTYQIELADSIPDLKVYLSRRDTVLEDDLNLPLFVSHDPRYKNNRMSRVIAWRIIQRAAKALGMSDVSPHDLRHWKAKQLIDEGASLQTVQAQLGHRSIHTVRNYYGHWLSDED